MAERGRKPTPPAMKESRGTERPDRDKYEVMEAPRGVVRTPPELPDLAAVVWEEYINTAMAMGTVKPADTDAFAHWCVMIANLRQSWQPGKELAPAAYVAQWRVLGECLGLMGPRSRLVAKPDGGNSANLFEKYARR